MPEVAPGERLGYTNAMLPGGGDHVTEVRLNFVLARPEARFGFVLARPEARFGSVLTRPKARFEFMLAGPKAPFDAFQDENPDGRSPAPRRDSSNAITF